MSKNKKLVGLGIVVVMVIAFLWFSPTILTYSQNSSGSSYDAPYTSLTLREGMNGTATLNFGDTEYTFTYTGGLLSYNTFVGLGNPSPPHNGDTYRDLGIEMKVSDVTSDYISDYVVILVKPTVQNYMASLYYTRVNLTLNEPTWVNISSGLVNETRQYCFTYTKVVYPSMYEPYVTIHSDGQEKTYQVYASGSYAWSTKINDFNIETAVFKTESNYAVIYVKPLY